MKYQLIINDTNWYKEYFYHDIEDALTDALSCQEGDCYAQMFEFANITLKELKADDCWCNWTDEEGYTLDDYILVNNKPMRMVWFFLYNYDKISLILYN